MRVAFRYSVYTILPWTDEDLACWFRRAPTRVRKMLKTSGHWTERSASQVWLKPCHSLALGLTPSWPWWHTVNWHAFSEKGDRQHLHCLPILMYRAWGKWKYFFWDIKSMNSWKVTVTVMWLFPGIHKQPSIHTIRPHDRTIPPKSSLMNQWVYWDYLQDDSEAAASQKSPPQQG